MKAAELVEQVRGLDGRIAVWSHLLETAEQLRGSPHPPQMRGVTEDHIVEVAQEIEASIADLKTARDDLMDKDVK
jgi:hypothetical protein